MKIRIETIVHYVRKHSAAPTAEEGVLTLLDPFPSSPLRRSGLRPDLGSPAPGHARPDGRPSWRGRCSPHPEALLVQLPRAPSRWGPARGGGGHAPAWR